ncbi:MAG: helix-turn-helix transcriptional regulator [Candidatus Sumerlaeia bacterium]|nr:helix-turn-helix transcriptional regulator [Candidatus Sumerlaeia bacterium]
MGIPQDTQEKLKEFGEAIRTARLAQQISLRQFAQVVELSPSYYSKVERGEALAGSETYELICNKLGLDAKLFLPKIGLIDTETRRLFEEHYRANTEELTGFLRKMSEKRQP